MLLLNTRTIKKYISLAITVLTIVVGFVSVYERINCEQDVVKITEISDIEKQYESNGNNEDLIPYYSASVTAESDSCKVYNFKIKRYNESSFPMVGESIEIGILENGEIFEYEEAFDTKEFLSDFNIPGVDSSVVDLSNFEINIE